jgi:hypothetical protein
MNATGHVLGKRNENGYADFSTIRSFYIEALKIAG